MKAIIPQGDLAEARVDVSWLFGEYAGELVRLISGALRSEDVGEAEDLAQDVWLGVWERAVADGRLESPACVLLDLAVARVAEFYGRPVAAATAEAVAA
jgi:hypothetical protein